MVTHYHAMTDFDLNKLMDVHFFRATLCHKVNKNTYYIHIDTFLHDYHSLKRQENTMSFIDCGCERVLLWNSWRMSDIIFLKIRQTYTLQTKSITTK